MLIKVSEEMNRLVDVKRMWNYFSLRLPEDKGLDLTVNLTWDKDHALEESSQIYDADKEPMLLINGKEIMEQAMTEMTCILGNQNETLRERFREIFVDHLIAELTSLELWNGGQTLEIDGPDGPFQVTDFQAGGVLTAIKEIGDCFANEEEYLILAKENGMIPDISEEFAEMLEEL